MVRKKRQDPEPSSLLSVDVQKYRELLAGDRFHGTIKQKRKEYTKKLEYLVDVLRGKSAVPAPEDIQYVGLKALSPEQARDVMQFTANAYKKFLRDLPDVKMVVHVKKYNATAKRAKYSVHLRLVGPNTVELLANMADWDLRLALQKAVANLTQEATHKFKKDVTPQRRKKFFRA